MICLLDKGQQDWLVALRAHGKHLTPWHGKLMASRAKDSAALLRQGQCRPATLCVLHVQLRHSTPILSFSLSSYNTKIVDHSLATHAMNLHCTPMSCICKVKEIGDI